MGARHGLATGIAAIWLGLQGLAPGHVHATPAAPGLAPAEAPVGASAAPEGTCLACWVRSQARTTVGTAAPGLACDGERAAPATLDDRKPSGTARRTSPGPRAPPSLPC